MSYCEAQVQDEVRIELADWTPIQTPDGLWCVWSERTGLPIKLGTKQAHLLADVSRALGSIDRAHDAFRAACADEARWERLLASLPPATARYLEGKVGEPVARREVVPLRQMPAISTAYAYMIGDMPSPVIQAARQEAAAAAVPGAQGAYGRTYRRTSANTPKYDDKIRALHAEGLHSTGIAARIGCAPGTVREGLDRMGLIPHPAPVLTPKPRARAEHPMDGPVAELHAEGLYSAEIARRLGVSAKVVIRCLKGLDLTSHKAPPQGNAKQGVRAARSLAGDDPRRAEIVSRYKGGATIEQVAVEVKYGKKRVRAVLVAAGVQIRPPTNGMTTAHGETT